MTTNFSTEHLNCTLTGTPTAEYWVIRPVHGQEEAPEHPAERMETLAPGCDFCLITLHVPDWFGALSPWAADAVIGGQPFAGRGEETLHALRTELLPALRQRYGEGHTCILAGYSLAGLFALWAACETDCFDGVAAMSPSLWFPGWGAYAAARRPQIGAVYLSLGIREEKSRNPVMATVGNAVRAQERLLREQNICCTLEWNPGGHFQEPEERTAKGIAWVLNTLKKQEPAAETARQTN